MNLGGNLTNSEIHFKKSRISEFFHVFLEIKSIN